jgi:hypothetical protein
MQETHFPNWSFFIGDPSLMGWLTVVAYFFASGLSYLIIKNSVKLFPQSTVKKQKVFWLVIALSLFALGVNKQLDLQSYMTAIGRYYAVQGGWYEQRQFVQHLFIKVIAVLSIALMLFLVWYLRGSLKYNCLAIGGLCILATYIAIRASSFHHVDIFLNSSIVSLRMNWLIELSGIFMISLSAGMILSPLLKR